MGWRSCSLLDYLQLPRIVRNPCLQRHLVQPRIAEPRRDICDAENHAGIGAHKSGVAGLLLSGNLDAKRDWGHAKDYVETQWLMLQQDQPDDYVIATGEQYSVKEFVNVTAEEMKMQISWRGKGVDEEGVDEHGRRVVAVDPRYFRPAEVASLQGDASKARRKLGWKPRIGFREMVTEMAAADLQNAERDLVMTNSGIRVYERQE